MDWVYAMWYLLREKLVTALTLLKSSQNSKVSTDKMQCCQESAFKGHRNEAVYREGQDKSNSPSAYILTLDYTSVSSRAQL